MVADHGLFLRGHADCCCKFHVVEVLGVEGHETTHVARVLEMSVGAVHIARSRVRGRLREAVQALEPDGEEKNSQLPTRGKDRDE